MKVQVTSQEIDWSRTFTGLTKKLVKFLKKSLKWEKVI